MLWRAVATRSCLKNSGEDLRVGGTGLVQDDTRYGIEGDSIVCLLSWMGETAPNKRNFQVSFQVLLSVRCALRAKTVTLDRKANLIGVALQVE